MKNLETTDLFKALRLLKITNLKEELKPLLKQAGEGKVDVTSLGIETILKVLEAFGGANAENALYDLLSGPFEMKAEEIGKMDVTELIPKIQQLYSEGNLKVFMKQLDGLISMKS